MNLLHLVDDFRGLCKKNKMKSITVLFNQHTDKMFPYSMLNIYLNTEVFSMNTFKLSRIFLHMSLANNVYGIVSHFSELVNVS